MAEFDGDLFIGGVRLKHLHGELDVDQRMEETADHLLAGRLTISASQQPLLEFGRRYRLQLDDGRAGAVIVSRIVAQRDDALVVEFQPLSPAPKPR